MTLVGLGATLHLPPPRGNREGTASTRNNLKNKTKGEKLRCPLSSRILLPRYRQGPLPEGSFVGVATGEVVSGAEPRSDFFLFSQNRRFCRFSRVSPGRLWLQESGGLVPATPGTVQQNDPKSSLLIRRGSRAGTPTASFYQITPFPGAV